MAVYNFPITVDRQFNNKLEELHDKYGTDLMTIEGMAPEQLDVCNFFDNFVDSRNVADTTIDDNANVTDKNINTMLQEGYKPYKKLMSRNKLYIEMKEEFGRETADLWLEKVVNGELYEHDSHDSSYKSYCFAFSLKNIVEKGLYFLSEMKAGRPKHWDTYNHHVLEFISYATNLQSGAVGTPDYLIYAYYFYMMDSKVMSEEGAKYYKNQKFQEFIFNLNQPYLKQGIQSAYTNLSILDRPHLNKFFDGVEYPNGDMILDHVDGFLEFQEDFLTYLGELRQEKWHTFPVLSASLQFKDDKYVDEETAKVVVKHNWQFGFNDCNLMNVPEVTSAATCCRLQSNLEDIKGTFNSIGGSDLNIGSTKVMTNNLVRCALLSDTFDDFLDKIRENQDITHKFHYIHRRVLQKNIDRGLLPLYTSKMMQMKDQYATTGIHGVFEAIKILGGVEYDQNGARYGELGFEMAEEMFKLINDTNEVTLDKYGFKANVEQIPGESAAVKLNKKDRLVFGNRVIDDALGKDCYIYGNQWIPLKEESSIFNRIDAARLDENCGGGAILHLNLGENFNTFEDAWEFTVGLAKKGVGYFSYISLIDICGEDHSFFGEECPLCGGPSVSKGIKIVGYLVKEDSYKKERQQELTERQFYSV